MQNALQFQRFQDLVDLGDQGSRLRLQEAHGLHGQSRSARHRPAMTQRLEGGAKQSERVDAGMAAKSLVLVCDQGLHVFGIDVGRRGRETPASVAREKGPERLALDRSDDLRSLRIARKVGKGGRRNERVRPSGKREACEGEVREDARERARRDHLACAPSALTSKVEDSER